MACICNKCIHKDVCEWKVSLSDFNKCSDFISEVHIIIRKEKTMDKSEVIKELSRIKHNCSQITDAECINGMCPYGKREPLKQGYKFQCLWEDLGMNAPCDWELPEEV